MIFNFPGMEEYLREKGKIKGRFLPSQRIILLYPTRGFSIFSPEWEEKDSKGLFLYFLKESGEGEENGPVFILMGKQ